MDQRKWVKNVYAFWACSIKSGWTNLKSTQTTNIDHWWLVSPVYDKYISSANFKRTSPIAYRFFLFIILAVKPCITKFIKGVLLPLLNADWPSAFVCARTFPLTLPLFIASNQRLRTKRYTHNFSWINTLSGDLVSTTHFD